MARTSSRVMTISDKERMSLVDRGIPLPTLAPLSRSKSQRLREIARLPSTKRSYISNPIPDVSNHIPGNCYQRKMQRSIAESRGAPPGVMYGLTTELPVVRRVNYNLVAPAVLDVTDSVALTQEQRVYFNASTGTVEAVISSNDKEAVRFYDNYYSCLPDNRIKIMDGASFVAYCDRMIVLVVNGEPRLWMDEDDLVHYIRTTAQSLKNVTINDIPPIRYAGINKHQRPAGIDLARVRSVALTYGM